VSISRQEEIISSLWTIAALLAFNGGHTLFGWFFGIKAVADTACTVYFALKKQNLNNAG